MNISDIVERIRAGEDERTEFKRGAEPKQIGPAISAFANSEGGLLVLGVDDGGQVVGVNEAAEKVSERLTAFLQSGLSSPVNARLGRHEDSAKRWLHWIEVPSQRGFEPIRHSGRVYVRRGRASVEPSPSELRELYNRFGYILTEEQSIARSGVDDIQRDAFERFMRRLGIDLADEPRMSFEDDLRIRGVLTMRGEELEATLYGLLAFGKDPQKYPQTLGFWIECVAYAGRDRADDVILVSDAKGRLDEQVDRALGFMKSLGRREIYSDIVRKDVPLVPEIALREALVNAVCHRDYAILGSRILLEVFDDRVVITSPGTLPNHMTPESAKAGGHPRSRNELLANYMQTMGYMEGRGRGWPRIRRAMKEESGLEPLLEEDKLARWVRVTLPIAG